MFQWFHLGVCILSVDPNGLEKQDGLAPQIVQLYSQEYEQECKQIQQRLEMVKSAPYQIIPPGTGSKVVALAHMVQCGGTKPKGKHHWRILKKSQISRSIRDQRKKI